MPGISEIAVKKISLCSWNVNGLRAIYKKGFSSWLASSNSDILAVQETKADPRQLSEELKSIAGYESYFVAAERKGYSGVALYTKSAPKLIIKGFGDLSFDSEGRSISADYGDFILYNVYFPNGKASRERLSYKLAFYDKFLEHITGLLKKDRKVILCGDVNTAHKEIDLARPKENRKISGFLPEERAWIDRLIARGFYDSFRIFNQGGANYTWWDMKTRARERNVGWRIDYFFISANLRGNLRAASILSGVMGSDHCPISITLEI